MSGRQGGRDPIEFHFDFGSPYAYFTAFKIDELAARFGREVDWRPFELGAALARTGRAGAASSAEVRAYLRHDCERLARLDARPFHWPAGFPCDGAPAARLYYWLRAQDGAAARRFAQGCLHAGFGEGRDIGMADVVLDAAAAAGAARAAAAAALDDPAVHDLLESATAAALARGVFGSPFVIVDGEAFWGSDRLWMVKRWLDWGGW